MKVLLKIDVDNLGYAGEVHQVAPGYGRNYLIPKGMAVKASPNTLKQAEAWRKRAEARRAEIHAEYKALSAKIEEVTLTFIARAGETGKLYGSITTAQIADDLNETLGTDIDRRKVGTEQLRQLGEHKVPVRLSAEFQPEFTVVIESEDMPAATEVVEDAATEAIDETEATETAVSEAESATDDEPTPETE